MFEALITVLIMTPIAFLYWFALFETDFISKNLNSTNSRGMATAIGLPILGPFIALEGDSVLGWSCNLLVISVVAYYFLYWRPNNPVELEEAEDVEEAEEEFVDEDLDAELTAFWESEEE